MQNINVTLPQQTDQLENYPYIVFGFFVKANNFSAPAGRFIGQWTERIKATYCYLVSQFFQATSQLYHLPFGPADLKVLN
ncbi:MAG: hypothetical protein A2509_10650 [Candidatus Edwardsbacteria bacterium RIFOXYD12_FULL_50_11]|uniref:Uncharacterized protein n=1 Tax=Candidatus Edwardsbacteria bacterium GWF2_54_11 TaxID=1817851 RepID=A0A1F5RFW9_9BACT|nr:MAG: hypothetical protein A2502_09355 [Candidatus Edwardsbacteria bacterium RifOxyC12_full_54_24]OGF07212.1 MAG: hypothetical protein A2273_01700 [Candidatus Edwardsbacteria bacterium RifOxyA12_full_54_48]OGF09467.1 MAG: hypothetical protein A3K15_08110 [Candidatus Edwardsbacteria bacterium GWE2_54_12]OGF13397.1 MAG: hypothetical protein A2024_05275 [Candidatus Edwardsbacteria bacterium GWF2_54_11]OGF17267.1 MAG: hypothetical protein A2509_10650 [Candidatus Edwardsbacteria bacterium RIFOXYD1